MSGKIALMGTMAAVAAFVLGGCTTASVEGNNVERPRIKTAVYVGAGPSGIGACEHVRRIVSSPDLEIMPVSADDVRAGKLKDAELLVMPGGHSINIYDSLGKEGTEKVKAFIREGGAYFGTCAGCCYLMDGSFKRARVIPYNTRGAVRDLLFLRYDFNEEGARTLGIKPGCHVMRYHGGPLMRATTNIIDGADFKVWATVKTVPDPPKNKKSATGQKGKDGFQPSPTMEGAVGVVGGTYGKGRVVVTSGHPEYFEESFQTFMKGALEWLTDRKLTFPRRFRHHGAPIVGYMSGTLKNDVQNVLALERSEEVDVRILNAHDIWRGELAYLDVVVTRGNPDSAELKDFRAHGGKVVVLNGKVRENPEQGIFTATTESLMGTLRRAMK